MAFFTESVDEYVLEGLREYKGKKLVAANRAGIELEDVADEESGTSLPEEETGNLVSWLNSTLDDRVTRVDAGVRLVKHPMVALLPEDAPNAQMRAMMAAMGQEVPAAKAKLEINPRHPLIHKLAALQDSQRDLAAKVARQLTDHALLAAGLDVNAGDVSEGMSELLGELLEERAGS